MGSPNRKPKQAVDSSTAESRNATDQSEVRKIGRRLILRFVGDEVPVLERIEFQPKQGTDSKFWERGHAFENFAWTEVPKALAILFVEYAAWGKARQPRDFFFTGKCRGSLAASLGDAIHKGDDRIHDLFVESVASGKTVSRVKLVFDGSKGDNVHGKASDKRDRRIAVSLGYLPPDCMEVFWDSRGSSALTNLDDLQTLAKRIRIHLGLPSAQIQELPALDSGADDFLALTPPPPPQEPVGDVPAASQLQAQAGKSKSHGAADSMRSNLQSATPMDLLRTELDLKPSQSFLKLSRLARDLQNNITIGELTIETVLGDWHEPFRETDIKFEVTDPFCPPEYVTGQLPQVREERRLIRGEKTEDEDNKPKLHVWAAHESPVGDNLNILKLKVARSDFYTSLAMDRVRQLIWTDLASRGREAQFPFRLNTVAVVVSEDKEFVWVKRNKRTQYFPGQWAALGETFDSVRDFRNGKFDAALPIKAILEERDELNLPGGTFENADVRFTALVTYWNYFLQDLYAIVKVRLPSATILQYAALGGGEHEELAMVPFNLDSCLDLLARKTYEQYDQPDTKGEISDMGKVAVLTALLSESGDQVFDSLRDRHRKRSLPRQSA